MVTNFFNRVKGAMLNYSEHSSRWEDMSGIWAPQDGQHHPPALSYSLETLVPLLPWRSHYVVAMATVPLATRFNGKIGQTGDSKLI